MSIYVSVKKSFGDFTLDVTFEAGSEAIGLLGASGCGKSMTLKCIAGIVRPDEGRIVVDGTPLFDSEKGIDLSPQKRRVGLLFQNYALFPNMTVEENISVVLRSDGGGRGVQERAAELLEKFHLQGLRHRYPPQLSGGQQQRAALARIMARNPSVLMLDEPLSALDSYLRWQLEEELLQTFEAFEGTTLYVSHSRDEVYRLCKKVCVMHLGRNEGERPGVRSVQDLFESPNTFASAILSGCKNYSRAERLDEHVVHAVDWGLNLACGALDSVDYIGVRAHHITLGEAPPEPPLQPSACLDSRYTGSERLRNVFPCRVLRVVQDVFSAIVTLQPLNASHSNFSRIRVELPKQEGRFETGDIVSAQIKPEDVLLLKTGFPVEKN